MRKFGDASHGCAILVEKKDLESGHLAYKLKGQRADYFIVPAKVKQDKEAMELLSTCTEFKTDSCTTQFAEILFYE